MPGRILVVDDDQDTLRLLTLILQNWGFEPATAENGSQALASMAERPPVLVLCDVLMPVLDGYQTLLAIRSDPQTRSIPVLMLSALGQERDVQRAIAAGANGYIMKPFALKTLRSQIQQHVG